MLAYQTYYYGLKRVGFAIWKSYKRVRGRPFDSEGGGWHFWSGQIIYFHYVLGRKICFRVNRGQKIYFQPQQIFEKSKTKIRKKKGGLVRGFCRGGRTWLSMFCITFCRLLAREWVSDYGYLTSHLTIFQSYMWRHIYVQADWRRKKELNLRSGSQAIDIS